MELDTVYKRYLRCDASLTKLGHSSSLQWQLTNSATDVAPTLPEFTKTHGPLVSLGSEASPLEFFSLFFDDSVLDLLVEEANWLVRE